MRQVECSRCRASLPLSDTFDVLGQTVCEPCGNEMIAEHGQPLAPGDVSRNVDPTICHWCQQEGEEDFPTAGGMPVCGGCESRLRNFPYPGWIKISFVALVVLGIGSFLYNYRFADALFASRRAFKAFAAGDLETAAERMDRAASLVPEVADFRDDANYFRGLQLFRDDRPKEALPLLVAMQRKNPGVPLFPQLVLQAESAVAFEDNRYDVMLEKTLALANTQPNERSLKYHVASAYACRYAETGDTAFEDKALAALAEGDKLGDEGQKMDEAAYQDFRQRLLFRLTTREIISKKEFAERFPQGWKGADKTE